MIDTGENVQKGHYYTLHWEYKLMCPPLRTVEVPQIPKNRTAIGFTFVSTLDVYPKEMKTAYQKDTCACVHCNNIHDNKDMESDYMHNNM